jgi:hypothetical protein
MFHKAIATAFLSLCLLHPLSALAHSDSDIRQQIIHDSVNDYLTTGHPCACPYNTARNGSSCGGRSAYSRPGGAAPLCYPNDITDQMVTEWKKQHGNS